MIPHDSANALELHDCPACGFEHTHKFCWDAGKFWVGKVKNKFIAWIVYITIQSIALFTKIIPAQHVGTLIIVTAIVTFIFMLAGSIDAAVGNARIALEGKATKNKTEVKNETRNSN